MMIRSMRGSTVFTALLVMTAALTLATSGCDRVGSQDSAARDEMIGQPAMFRPPVEAAFLNSSGWNDGKAEIAFYKVRRPEGRSGNSGEQLFVAGTYLVRHEFNQATQSKATSPTQDGLSSFKWAIFYEVESSNSYQFKYNYVINAAQADLHPLKASFTSFDWCSNQYRELAFLPDGTVEHLMRSDDYGNEEKTFRYPRGSYPVTLLPLLVRALDFSDTNTQPFLVLLDDGSTIQARAEKRGPDSVETPEGPLEATKIIVRYDAPVPSLIVQTADPSETYWRGTGSDRLLLKLEGEGGRYSMTLVEKIRSPYWSENIFPMLEHIHARP